MKSIYLPILAVTLIFTACKENHAPHQDHHDDHVGAEELQMTLNDGQKWKMDGHTRTMLTTMTETVEAGGDIHAVGKSLKSDLDQLIQGCTMTGEAHNQLHLFLTPFIPAVQEMSATGSVESLNKVKELLHEYPQYFE